jgi:hypothetical protein
MDPSFLSGFLGGGKGGGLPPLGSSASSDATGGTSITPWYQGDVVLAGGDARTDSTGVPGQGVLQGALSAPVLIAVIAVVGVIAWRRLSK